MGKKQVPNPSCNKQNPFKWYLKESPNCLYRRYHLGVDMGSWAQAAPAGMMRWWMGLVPMIHEERSYGDREFYEWEATLHTERAAGVGSRDLSAVYVQEHDQGKMGKLIKPGKLCSPIVCTAGIIIWAIPEWKADMPEASLLFMPSLFGPFKNSHLRYLKR